MEPSDSVPTLVDNQLQIIATEDESFRQFGSCNSYG